MERTHFLADYLNIIDLLLGSVHQCLLFASKIRVQSNLMTQFQSSPSDTVQVPENWLQNFCDPQVRPHGNGWLEPSYVHVRNPPLANKSVGSQRKGISES